MGGSPCGPADRLPAAGRHLPGQEETAQRRDRAAMERGLIQQSAAYRKLAHRDRREPSIIIIAIIITCAASQSGRWRCATKGVGCCDSHCAEVSTFLHTYTYAHSFMHKYTGRRLRPALCREYCCRNSPGMTHMQHMNAIYLRTYMYVCMYVFMEINPIMCTLCILGKSR